MIRVNGADVRYRRLGVFDRLLGGCVAEVRGREIAVHAYSSYEGALAFFEADGGEKVR